MKNTPENKERFFAQYWKQDVGRIVSTHGTVLNYNITPNPFLLQNEREGYLELKPLSQITDEDAAELMYFLEEKEFVNRLSDKAAWGKSFVEKFEKFHLTPQSQVETDHFLRSKGYALPWMGISVEEQIEFGWIKLKE